MTAIPLRAESAPVPPTRGLERAAAAVNRRLERVPVPHAATTVYVGSMVWSLGFAIASAVRYSHFQDRRYDLGNFVQVVWTTAHGHFLETTNAAGAQVSRLGIHVDPIVAALAPLWWLWPSPVLLLTVQAVAMGGAAIPLFWLARKHLARQRDAAFIAFSYLLCPSVGWNTLTEFHATALAVPLLLLTVWFLDEQRLAAFAGCAVAAMMCQELVAPIIACLGLWFGFRSHRLRAGFAIAAGALLITAFDFQVILHRFGGGTPYSARFAGVGGSISGVAKTAFTDPAKIVATLQPSDALGVILLLIPVFGLSLRSPVILAALPQAILLTMSGNRFDWNYMAQNVLLIIPFVYAGATLALAKREREKATRYRVRPEHVFLCSLLFALVLGPVLTRRVAPSARHLSAERRAIAMVPSDARVSATNYLGSHLAARRYAYVFPSVAKADWVVVDTADPYLPPQSTIKGNRVAVGVRDLKFEPRLTSQAVRRLRHDRTWREVFVASTVRVFERRDASVSYPHRGPAHDWR